MKVRWAKFICDWRERPMKDKGCDSLDWTHPDAKRLSIETRYGLLILDYLSDGINAFYFDDEDDRRDILVMPARRRSLAREGKAWSETKSLKGAEHEE